MTWRDYVERNGFRLFSLCSYNLNRLCAVRLHEASNAGVPVIVAHMVLVKKKIIIIIIIILNEGFHFLRINLLQLKVGFFSLFQCEIKIIHQTIIFL